MTKKTTHANLYAALAAAQGAFPPIPKSKTARVRMKTGGEYTYAYADLADVIAAVSPALSANGLAFVQKITDETETIPTPDGERVVGLIAVETLLFHESGGEPLSSTLRVSCADEPQAIGSASSYLRRYGLAAMIGVAPEADDDGAKGKDSSPATEKRGSRKKPASKPKPKPEAVAFSNLRREIARLGAKNRSDADAVVRMTTVDADGVPRVSGLDELDPETSATDPDEIVRWIEHIVRSVELSRSEDRLSDAEILDYARQTQRSKGGE